MVKSPIKFCLLSLTIVSYTFALPPTKAAHVNSSGCGGLRGVIIEPCGIPVEGVQVTLNDNRGRTLFDITNKQGEFTVGNLLPGKYRFSTKKSNYWNLGSEIEIRANAWLTFGQKVDMTDGLGGAILFKNEFSFYTYTVDCFSITTEEISKLPIH